jgi:hypothetical protein
MPPQQPDRLLDLFDQLVDFRAHDVIRLARRFPANSATM